MKRSKFPIWANNQNTGTPYTINWRCLFVSLYLHLQIYWYRTLVGLVHPRYFKGNHKTSDDVPGFVCMRRGLQFNALSADKLHLWSVILSSLPIRLDIQYIDISACNCYEYIYQDDWSRRLDKKGLNPQILLVNGGLKVWPEAWRRQTL